MTETKLKKVQTVSTISPTVEVPTNQQQQVVEKNCIGDEGVCWDCKSKQPITLKGFTTSRVEQASKGSKTRGKSPYPARVFLRLDCIDCHNTKQVCQALTPKHRKCEECAKQKCRECEIPVFFRIKDPIKSKFREFLDPNFIGTYEMEINNCPFCEKALETKYYRKWCWNEKEKSGSWIKPKIKKGSYLQVQGHFDKPIKSHRKSFTAYSYHLLDQQTNSQILAHVQS